MSSVLALDPPLISEDDEEDINDSQVVASSTSFDSTTPYTCELSVGNIPSIESSLVSAAHSSLSSFSSFVWLLARKPNKARNSPQQKHERVHESIIPPSHHLSNCPPSPNRAVMRHRMHHSSSCENLPPIAAGPVQSPDDADIAAGSKLAIIAHPEPPSRVDPEAATNHLPTHHHNHGNPHTHQPMDVLGFDISHLPRHSQFLTCAGGVFAFTLGYGFLQELIAVHLCNRKLGLFLAMCQFAGYTFWSFILRTHVDKKRAAKSLSLKAQHVVPVKDVPFEFYLGLSLLRAVDLAMTNMAMQYINYPAKTLMKSSRVVFTMLFGAIIARRRYKKADYAVVFLMSAGLFIFMRADAKSSAVFQPLGVIMLTVSLLCDGAITNLSEAIMKKYNVGQDEFIFRMYSIALLAITIAAFAKGELIEGFRFMFMDGTLGELETGLNPTWTSSGKICVMATFATLGFFGSSCSAAITKSFGALTMSVTSTTRKATTLFLSFAIFPNAARSSM
eukprot:CAMPEP_0172484662 /NCGR_PEP_ID=MMETSP1066-20121228/12211_1 /TAXON_ID=671091 /ORGANISM="Coscinodiscus wailesii, Strain CCMP2513" /LENGTH=503 /DNA_ID=CAMNT_0013249325 /DNA_START=55 /DNA_END=1567 /DNA_ORIENTATION=-